MSVIITIEDNREYCQAHGLMQKHRETCPTCNGYGCVFCDSGTICFDVAPMELRMDRPGWTLLWAAVGLDPTRWGGRIDGRRLAELLDKATDDQFVDSVAVLRGICEEAERREENVIWF